MEILLVVCLIVILVVRWAYLRDRLDHIEERLQMLAAAVASAPPVRPVEPAPAPVVAPPPPPPPARAVPAPMPIPPRPAMPIPPPPSFTTPATPQRSSEEWEALLGGNWLNKLGVFVLVIGIALALAYSYKLLGPAGRVAVSLAISFAMLGSGVLVERRERYRIFASGLIGGGWAALYFTVYAMQALEPARVIHNPWSGAFLLLAVAIGMIVHSLRYRSQTITGLAYFIAFGTLAITEVTALSLAALVPLAASLLYVSHRFRWSGMALFGLIATYATCAARPDNGAPLWEAQAIFATYWLIFEAFDIFRADTWLLPLNAAGFLGLSLFKWESSAPDHIWQLLAATSAAYLVSAILRARSGRWQMAITLSAGPAAAAMFLRLEHQWIALGLIVAGELLYLAGVRLRASYLRLVAALLFVVGISQLLAGEVGQLPVRQWTPIATFAAVCFYVNRALRREDIFYGFAGAAVAATVAGFEAPGQYRASTWLAMALVPYGLGWWRRLADFRLQGYLLVLVGLVGVALDPTRLSLSLAAMVSYGVTLSVLLSDAGRFDQNELDLVPRAGSVAATMATAALLWRVVPREYMGLSWMALALLLLELGLRGLPKHFTRLAYGLAALGAWCSLGPWEHRWIPAAAAALSYGMAVRAHKEEGGAVLAVASTAGSAFAMAAVWALLPGYAVAPSWMALALLLSIFDIPALRWETHAVSLAAAGWALANMADSPHRWLAVGIVLAIHYFLAWRTGQRFYWYTGAALASAWMYFGLRPDFIAAGWAIFAAALLYAGRRWELPDLGWQSCALAAMAFARCWYLGIEGAAPVIASLYAAQLLSQRDTRERVYYSLLATTLVSLVPYYQVEGSLRTVVWGAEGVVLLASGFPLRDRTLRISGLALLLGCILKLFMWDLRHLETMPRILSFIVLGLFLVGVSWVYTRFRERVAQYL